jgi:predicted nucleic acid-binding protein
VAVTTYLDASALVKILLREADEDDARLLWRAAGRRATSVVAYVEASAAISAAVRDGRLGEAAARRRRAELDRRWEEVDPVGLDDDLLRMAGDVANEAGLRALDAIHLATALYLGLPTVLFVTWDGRLAASAARLGLAVAPASLA